MKKEEINWRSVKHIKFTQDDLIRTIDSLFKQALETPEIQRNATVYENLSLKYISFIQKYIGNSLLSYFFLKKLSHNERQLSQFFYLLFEVYSEKLKYKILALNVTNSITSAQVERLSIDTIQAVEEFSQAFNEQIFKVLTLKLQIWETLSQGCNNLDVLYHKIRDPLKSIILIQGELLWGFANFFSNQDKLQLEENAGYQKLQQIYNLIVNNDNSTVRKLEMKIIELRKHDQYKDELFLNNYNYMNGDSVIIKAGISIQNGKILNKNNRQAEFFGFNENEWRSISTINQLMPFHIAVMHDKILAQYLTKGFSALMTTTRKVYIVNRSQFLFPVSICVRNDFTSLHDCVFNATVLKIRTNKEFIMFNEFGQIIGYIFEILLNKIRFSEKLFKMVSRLKGTCTDFFNYATLREKGRIFLLCPNILKLFYVIKSQIVEAQSNGSDTASLQFNNLACSFFTNMNTLDLFEEFNVQHRKKTNNNNNSMMLSQMSRNSQSSQNRLVQDFSLLVKADLNKMNRFIRTNRQLYMVEEDQGQRYKLRFTLHMFYRSLTNIDKRVLSAILSNQKIPDTGQSEIVYFVMEISEALRTINRPKNIGGILGQTGFSTMVGGITMMDRSSFRLSARDMQDEENLNSQAQTLRDFQENSEFQQSQHSQNELMKDSFRDLRQKEFEMLDNISDISEKKEGLNIQGGIENEEEDEVIREYFKEEACPQPPIPIDSPKDTFRILLPNNDLTLQDIDQKKSHFLEAMKNFTKNITVKSKLSSEVNPVILNKNRVLEEDQPPDIEDFQEEIQVQKPKNFGRIEEQDEMKEEDLFNEDSDELIQEEEQVMSGTKKKKKNQRAKLNVNRLKFDGDVSSQNSRASYAGNLSVSEIFIHGKMPSNYKTYLVAIALMILTVGLCLAIQVNITISGFTQIDYFNNNIDVPYILNTNFDLVLLGRFLLLANQNGIIQATQNQTDLWVGYINSSIVSQRELIKQDQNYEDFQLDFSIYSSSNSTIQQRFDLSSFSYNQLEMYIEILHDYQIQMINSSNIISQRKVSEATFLSLLARLFKNIEVITQLNENTSRDLSQLQDSLLYNFQLIFYCASAFILCQTIILLGTYKHFLGFNEKILLIVTRVTQYEYLTEVDKLNFAKNIVSKMKGSAVITRDFIPDIIYYNEEKEKKELQMREQNLLKGKNIIQQTISIGNLLQSKIYNPSFSIWKFTVQFLIIFMIVFLFFLGGVIYTLQIPSQYMKLTQHYISSVNIFTQLSQSMVYSEILAYGHLVDENYKEGIVFNLDRKNITDKFRDALEQFSDFNQYETVFGGKENFALKDLVYENLCINEIAIDVFKEICSGKFNTFYNKGIKGLMSQIVYLFTSYGSVFNQTQNKVQVSQFLNSDEHWALISYFGITTQKALIVMLDLLQADMKTLSNDLQTGLLQYLLITGVLLTILLCVYFYRNITQLEDCVQSTIFLLTFIPYEKLNEATTCQMLKAIKQY